MDYLLKDEVEDLVLSSCSARDVTKPEEVEKRDFQDGGERTLQETIIGKDERIGVGVEAAGLVKDIEEGSDVCTDGRLLRANDDDTFKDSVAEKDQSKIGDGRFGHANEEAKGSKDVEVPRGRLGRSAMDVAVEWGPWQGLGKRGGKETMREEPAVWVRSKELRMTWSGRVLSDIFTWSRRQRQEVAREEEEMEATGQRAEGEKEERGGRRTDLSGDSLATSKAGSIAKGAKVGPVLVEDRGSEGLVEVGGQYWTMRSRRR